MNMDQKDFTANILPLSTRPAFEMEGYWVWCGSVIRDENGVYNMFASAWSKKYPFHPGWGVDSIIVRATSKTLEGPFEFQEVVLDKRGAGYWDGRSVHNPSIHKCGDTYLLFYMGTTFPYPDLTEEDNLNHHSLQWLSARSNKRIGIATSHSLSGPWTRPDHPALDVRPGCFDDFFTSNPAPCVNKDGSVLLVYKTRTYAEPPYADPEMDMFSEMKLGVAFADHWSKPFRRLSDEPIFDTRKGSLEDPFIWRNGSSYSMIAKDWSGCHTGKVGAMTYASSDDGVVWNIEEGFTVLDMDLPFEDGTTRHLGNLDRPFLYIEDGEIKALYVATNDASEAGFKTLTRSWNQCIRFR